MAMTPSELSLKVKSDGIAQAAKDLESLAKAAASVDKETKDFVVAQSKVQAANKESAKSAESAARGISAQELAMVKAHEAALKMHNTFMKQAATAEKLAASSEMTARGISKQELAMVKAHEQALKMNSAFDKQADGLSKLHTHGSIWNNTLKSMAVAASAYIGVNFAKGVIEQADAWGLMQAKLKLSTGSMEAARDTQSQLLDVAQKIRIPLADSAQLYNRMAIPMAKMGKSAQETMNMVESMGLALKISGATAQEASSVMLQFSQSMNAGRLNGAEFNAVAEGAPIILRAIETELRATGQWGEHTTETLKKMGSEGKISAELISRAMQRALPEFRRDFETLPLTVDGALQRIKNAWLAAIGEISQDTEMNKKIADSIKSLEEIIPAFAKTVVNALVFVNDHFGMIATSLAIMTGASVISGISSMVAGLWAMATEAASVSTAVAAIPFVGLAALLATIGYNIGYLSAEWIDSKLNMEEYAKASNEKNQQILTGSEQNLLAFDKEIKKLQEQYNLIKGIKDLTSTEESASPLEKKRAEVLLAKQQLDAEEKLIENFKKTKPLIAEQMEASYTKRRLANDAEMAASTELMLQQAITTNAVKQADEAKKRAELNKVYRFDTKALIENEMKALDGAGLSAKEYAKAVKEINEKYKEKPAVDKYKEERAEVIKLNISLEEYKSKLELIQQYGVDDKRLESEKQLNKLQIQRASLTDAEAIRLKDRAIAIAKNAVVVEKELVLEKKIRQSEVSRLEDADKTLKQAEEELLKQKDLYEAYGKSEEVLITLSNARLQLNLETETAILKDMRLVSIDEKMINTQQGVVDAIKRTIEARKEAAQYKDKREALQEADEQAKKYEDAYQAANKKIADGLYNAIGKSGENAVKKLIRDIKEWFARLVLSPIINPISQFGASIISPNAKSAQGGVTDLMSMGKSIWDGFSGAGAASGAAFSQFAMSSMGQTLGLSSSTAASALLAEEAALTGSALGTSSAGTVGLTSAGSAGASVASAMPYVMAAIAAFQGVKAINGDYRLGGLSADAGALLGVAPRLFGMQGKVFQDQFVKGNLGTDDLTRNQPWTQKGGLFRSDRSDTWDYKLSTSSTMRDGKTYTDTANAAADKALLNQLNSTYDALKKSTEVFADSLGLNADMLVNRTDAINFSFGKTAEETSANINKMFEEVGNKIAAELLGELSSLAKVGEGALTTLARLAVDLKTVNDAYKVLGFSLYENNVNGIKAAEALLTFAGGLDNFKTVVSSYYDNFYTENEKTAKAMEELTKQFKAISTDALPTTREGFRALVDAAQKAGNTELVFNLMKLSSEFARLVPIVEDTADAAAKLKPLEEAKATLDRLADSASKWLDVKNKAATLQDEIQSAMGNPKRDPAIRMQQLWNAMSQDVTAEQKLALAGELKDLVLQKYQVEKDSMTRLIDFGKQLRGYVDSLKLGSLSPLTVGQKLSEAQAQYQTTLAKAQGGDVEAQGMLQGKADSYLQIAQTALASSSEYVAIFNSVTGSLDSLGIESMSAAEQANMIASDNLVELQKLSDFVKGVEDTATLYYNESLVKMQAQLDKLTEVSSKLGMFEGMQVTLANLPAEIAAALMNSSANSNAKFVEDLYARIEGRTGSQIDQAGLNYWINEAFMYGKESVASNFAIAARENSIPPAPMNMVSSEIKSLKEELVAVVQQMKDENNAGNAAVIESIFNSGANNANTVVTGTSEAIDNLNYNRKGVELV